MRVMMVAGLVLALGLAAACVAPGGGPGTRAKPASVLGGALTVRPPAGYCIDPTASLEADDRAVLLMGRCSDAAQVQPAVLTLSVAEAGSASVLAAGGQAMADYVTSAPGRAALSRSGRAGDLRVIEAFGRGPAFQMHLADRAVGDYWRAVVGVRGRLVTLSVTPPEGSPLPPEAGRALLETALDALLATNPA